MSSHLSFGDQGQRYFRRPHTHVPEAPLTSADAWLSADLKENADHWCYTLTAEEISEIAAATQTALSAGRKLEDITRDNFELPNLAGRVLTWRDNIMIGPGLKLIKGLPLETMTTEEIEAAFWGIGHHLGVPGAQNPANELLGHVTDYGERADDPFVRLYRTAANIRFHCDPADIVGLLCIQPAKHGGQSRLVSTVTLFNELLKQKPHLVSRLFEPFRMDLRGETKKDQKPYSLVAPAQFADDRLRTFYHSDYFRSVERHEGITLTAEEQEILDFYDELALDPTYHLDMWLEPGDMQFVCNHTIAHARTAYEDNPDSRQKRHLLRLWLSAA